MADKKKGELYATNRENKNLSVFPKDNSELQTLQRNQTDLINRSEEIKDLASVHKEEGQILLKNKELNELDNIPEDRKELSVRNEGNSALKLPEEKMTDLTEFNKEPSSLTET